MSRSTPYFSNLSKLCLFDNVPVVRCVSVSLCVRFCACVVFYVRCDLFSSAKLIQVHSLRQKPVLPATYTGYDSSKAYKRRFYFEFIHYILNSFILNLILIICISFRCFFIPSDDNVLHYTVLWSPNRFKCLISYVFYSVFLLIVLWRARFLCQHRVTYRFRERLMIATDKF